MLHAMRPHEDGLHGGEGGGGGGAQFPSLPLSGLPERARVTFSSGGATRSARGAPPHYHKMTAARPSSSPLVARRRLPARALVVWPRACTSTSWSTSPPPCGQVLTAAATTPFLCLSTLPCVDLPHHRLGRPPLLASRRTFCDDARPSRRGRPRPAPRVQHGHHVDVVGMAVRAPPAWQGQGAFSARPTGATLVALAAQRAPHRFAHLLLNGLTNMTRQMETVRNGLHDICACRDGCCPPPRPRHGVLTMLVLPRLPHAVVLRDGVLPPVTFSGSAYYPSGGTRVFAEAALALPPGERARHLHLTCGPTPRTRWTSPSCPESDLYMSHAGDVVHARARARALPRPARGASQRLARRAPRGAGGLPRRCEGDGGGVRRRVI